MEFDLDVGTGQPDEEPGWLYRNVRVPFALDFADGTPRNVRYLSKRLLTAEFQQLTAFERSAFSVTKVDSRFHGVGIVAERRDDPENPYWLAKVVANARRPSAARIVDCVAGDLTIFRMTARFGELRAYEQKVRVAWFTGLAGRPDDPTLVALCGSLANFIGYCPPEGDTFVGWYPSAAEGLDDFLRRAAEVTLQRESYVGSNPRGERARLVDGIYRGRHDPEFASQGEVDVLAQVHEVLTLDDLDPVEWPDPDYRRIVLAAPLIVTDTPVATLRSPRSWRVRLGEWIAGRSFPRD